jgi:ribosomal protein L16 Arg81 hydroxylase
MAKSTETKSNTISLKTFARTHWEKSACVLKAPLPLAEISADDIFVLLVRFCDLARENDSMSGLKFYVSGVRLEPFEALEHLPVNEDRGFTGYHKRMSRVFKDYGLVCDELYSVMIGDMSRTRTSIQNFTTPLFECVGLPNRFAEIGLYIGNYKKTPFGVHVDRCGVLSLPVVGKKNFRVWKSAIVEQNPELMQSFSYEEFKKDSIRLNAQPGEMAYWPSADWHIAEGDGSFSATWSLGVWVDRPVHEAAIDAVSPLLKKKLEIALKSRGNKTALKNSEQLPAELELAAEALSKLSKKEIRDVLQEWWSAHFQSSGFKT